MGEGFITVLRFKEILKEIDEDFTDDEIEGIVIDVSESLQFNLNILANLDIIFFRQT